MRNCPLLGLTLLRVLGVSVAGPTRAFAPALLTAGGRPSESAADARRCAPCARAGTGLRGRGCGGGAAGAGRAQLARMLSSALVERRRWAAMAAKLEQELVVRAGGHGQGKSHVQVEATKNCDCYVPPHSAGEM